jgi:hypothetical protein
MKRLLLGAFAAVLFGSCSSDDDVSGTSLASQPDAKEIYDDNNFGVYKGVFVGSSGVVTININNNDGITATLVIDGHPQNFTTTENVEENTSINGLTFTNGSDSFDFYVSGSGNFPTIADIVISGHPNANIEVLKEFSYAQVKCFQGTFSGDDTGVFNLILSEGILDGLAKSDDNNESFYLDGYINDDDTISGTFNGGVFEGEINGNSMSGQWQNFAAESGNWSGTRKL